MAFIVGTVTFTHLDNKIDMSVLIKVIKCINIEPRVDHFVFQNGNGVIDLAEGRLLKL